MKSFDPTAYGFVFLPDHTPAKGVRFYEHKTHPDIDGTPNYHRLNTYLSQDGAFVNIWHGCLEPIALEVFFQKMNVPFVEYDEPLFRGYIETKEEGEMILKALRVESMSPQIIEQTEDGKIACNLLGP